MRAIRIRRSALVLCLSVSASFLEAAKATDRDRTLALNREFNQRSVAEVQELIRAIDVLLGKPKNQISRDTLVLNKATYEIMLARVDLIKSKALTLTARGNGYLADADAELKKFVAAGSKGADQLARTWFLFGMIAFYRNEDYTEQFDRSLKLAPHSKSAPWMGLMLGEHYFDDEQYGEARAFYARSLNEYTVEEKDLAIYKLGWCALNLKHYDQAEGYFADLIKNRNASEYARDAVKDLAYVESLYKTDLEIIDHSKTIFKEGSKDQTDFFTAVVGYRDSRQQLNMRSPLLKFLVGRKSSADVGIKYYLSALKSARRGYASHDHLRAYNAVKKIYVSGRAENVDGLMAEESEKLIRAFYETYSDKVKSPENWSKEELSKELMQEVTFYLSKFPKDGFSTKLVAVKSDLCATLKDLQCMMDMQRATLNDPRQVARHEAAQYELNKIYDELYKKDRDEHRDEAIKEAIVYLEKYPRGPHYTPMAHRLAEYYTDAKEYPKAVEVLDRAFATTSSSETFLKLQNLRFEMRLYADIVNDRRPAQTNEKLVAVRREAALRKAIADKASGHNRDYETSINVFLDHNPDQAKARVARIDYFKTLLSKNLFDKLKEAWLHLDVSERAQPAYKAILNALWMNYFKAGNFEVCKNILPNLPDYQYLRLVSAIAANESLPAKELQRAPKEERAYLQSLLLLFRPAEVLSYYRNQTPRSPDDLGLASWAYKLSQNVSDIPQNSLTQKIFGRNLKFKDEREFSSLRARIRAIVLPSADYSPAVYTRQFTKALEGVRNLRKLYATRSTNFTVDQQVRTTGELAELEQKMAQSILASPVPKTLQGASLDEYKAGLNDAAKEFANQQVEYESIHKNYADKQLSESRLNAYAAQTEATWPAENYWTSDSLKDVRNLESDNRNVASLILWDLRQQEQHQNPEVYNRVRLRILKKLWVSNSLLRQYLAEGLKQSAQDKILDEWRGQNHET